MAKTRPEPRQTEAKTSSNKKKKSKNKKLKSVLSRPRGSKPTKEEKENPFETIWSRRKFDLLGRKRKGEERRVGLSRSLAIQKRKKTLLKEYEQSAKSSQFIDKRIGEQDDSLKEYEKAILRLQKERMSKLKRKNKFNLSDDEEETDMAVPFAESVSDKDDFEEFIPPDEDDADDNGELPQNLHIKDMSRSLNANLPAGEEQGHKSKKQVMAEIIEKSKFYKAQKAKEKEEEERLLEKLDRDFASLAQTDAFFVSSSKGNPSKALLNKKDATPSENEGLASSKFGESHNKDKPDAYDKLVKQMAMDARARPSDRTKTPEELAQQERERLEKLEEERQKRMHAPDDSSEDEEDSDDDGADGNKTTQKRLRSASGDDLGDSFVLDNDTANKKGWADAILDNRSDGSDDGEEEGDQEDGDEDEEEEEGDDDDDGDGDGDGDDDGEDEDEVEFGKNMSARDWEQSDEDEPIADPEGKEDINEKEIKTECKAGKAAIRNEKAVVEGLPFVIEAPSNLNELSALLDNRSETEVLEAINRIRACNSIRLGPENKRKMQVFYGVLVQYFAVLGSQGPVNLKIINSLVKPLIDMSTETPYFAAICARQRIIQIRTRFCEDLKTPGKSGWPSLKTVMLMRLWSMTFPCSDFRHPVMTPMLFLICEYLMRCQIESSRDLAVGCFLCCMLLSLTKQSKKFCPEAMMFLQTLLLSCIDGRQGFELPSQLSELDGHRTVKSWLCIDNEVCEVSHIDILSIIDMPPDSPVFSSDTFKASVLHLAAEALMGFAHVYEDLSAFPEIFEPVSSLLRTILDKYKIPSHLRGNLQDVADIIKKKTAEHHQLREPLQMRKKKPEPIRLLNPKFEENFVKGVDYDPDRERVKQKRLIKQLKSEKKGAIRELRKDNAFLLGVKERKMREQEEERAEKYGKAMSFLQEQEHAFKSGQLGKGRKRRR
ncbi:Nucleolar protein 14 [Rhynchospora pubera]|uniref:Nucleolar protein 14 n=1 Tax=Rhynchospora pubera TaxID=906938 RepID=A0AAV8F991_9POAL|nr:Nucleolar protein 14 [Rhynchospora pubera]